MLAKSLERAWWLIILMKSLTRYFLLTLLFILSACGTFEVSLDRTPTLNATAVPGESQAKADVYGTIYFWLSHSILDPKDPSNQIDVGRIVHLPGSCVFAVAECPAPEDVPVPFQIYSSSGQPMVWSLDGNMAALPVASTDEVAPMSVYVYRPQAESWTEIENFPIVDSMSWSPDGKWLSMRVQDGLGDVNIYAVRPDGSGQRNLTGENLPNKGEPSFLAMSGWLEGKALVATRGTFDELTTFHQVDPATGETDLLFTFPTYPGGIYPAPDHTLLAVEASSLQKQTLEIIQLDGRVEETLATFSKGGIYIVAWSHNGKKIAFTVQSEPYTALDHRVFIINRDGTGLAELYRGIVIPALTFSPDDRYLLFTDQERSLVSISLETLTVEKMPVPTAETGEQILYPSWQP
jgi:hypothetical protein